MSATNYYTFTTIQREKKYQIFQNGQVITNEQIDTAPIRMIEANEVSNVLPIDLEPIDAQLCVKYDITNLTTLKDYIQYKGITMNDTLALLEKVVAIIERAQRSGFDLNKFCVHSIDHIYVESHLHQFYLIYIPLKQQYQPTFQQNIEYLMSMLLTYVNDVEPSNVQQLQTVLRSPSFNIAQFQQLLQQLQLPPAINKANELAHSATPSSAKIERKSIRTTLNYVGGAAIVIAWGISTYFESYEGMIGAAVATGIFGVTLFLQNKRQKSITVEAVAEQPVNTPPVYVAPVQMPPQAPIPATAEPTVLLSQDHQKQQVAQPTTTLQSVLTLQMAQGNRVTVTNDAFTIGRNEDVVDYVVAALGVSRAHFQVVRLNDHEFGIKDLQSKNGTKLNGVKLESSKVYKVQQGDMIRFSSETMTVHLEHRYA